MAHEPALAPSADHEVDRLITLLASRNGGSNRGSNGQLRVRFSMGMLKQATSRRAGPWVQADAQRLSRATGSVDVVVSTEAFYWFPAPTPHCAEFHRVLARGGRLRVGVVNMRSEAVSRTASALAARFWQPAHWTTRADMGHRVEQAGVRAVRQQRVARIGGFVVPTVLTSACEATDPGSRRSRGRMGAGSSRPT